jgi:hypothetical protein
MELARKGNDFPTIWTAVLKADPLVDGFPESTHEGARPVVEVPLITGEKLVFDGDGKKFSLR